MPPTEPTAALRTALEQGYTTADGLFCIDAKVLAGALALLAGSLVPAPPVASQADDPSDTGPNGEPVYRQADDPSGATPGGLDVERLERAYANAEATVRDNRRHGFGRPFWQVFAAEYARLSEAEGDRPHR